MRKPNFFIIGAPKCGTSSLWNYLRTHPQIFLSDPKEPFFWCAEHPPEKRKASIRFHSLEEYLALFRGASDEHAIVGEASTGYLASATAIRRILEFNPDARFLASVRNPIDLIVSWHRDRIFAFDEDQDLETAWDLQEVRARGQQIPSSCLLPYLLQYKAAGQLGSQLEKLFTRIPRERVHLVVFDDLKNSPQRVYREVLCFLGLPDDGRADFSIVNEAKSQRLPLLGRLIKSPPPSVAKPINLFRRLARHLPYGRELGRVILSKRPDKSTVQLEFRQHLAEVFADEIHKLSMLLERDFAHWTR